MSHQDWNTVTFTKKDKPKDTKAPIKIVIPQKSMEAPKKLGLLISQGRQANNKTRQRLAAELCVSINILSKWETDKELPSNYEIASIEKNLGVKLPRCKKGARLDEN